MANHANHMQTYANHMQTICTPYANHMQTIYKPYANQTQIMIKYKLILFQVESYFKFKLAHSILLQVGSQPAEAEAPGHRPLRHWQQAAVGLCWTATNSQWKPSLCAGPGFKSPRTRTPVRVRPVVEGASANSPRPLRVGLLLRQRPICNLRDSAISAV